MTQIIYGIHPVEEALKAFRPQIEKIFIGAEKPGPALQKIVELAAQKRVATIFTSGKHLEQMAGGGVHQNVVAIVGEIPYATIEEILSCWKEEGTKALFLILDGIQDPQNLGAIIRTASASGVNGIIIPKDRAVGITPAVVKASAGAAAIIPVARVVNISNTVEILKKEGIWIYGAAGEARDLIFRLDFDVDLAVVIGAEEKGIRPFVKRNCDRLFSIPMKGPVSSFNASVSGGMILYEVIRQRSLDMNLPSAH